MEKLLQWSTAQESQDPEVRARAPAPDPKLLAQVLGADTGKDDATLMKEDISVLLCDDPRISIDDKLTALEDFEMLVQNLDNANNISPMGLWPEISKLYTYKGEEEDEFRGLAALITGTAAQNNTKCQLDFLKGVGIDGMKNLLKLTEKENNFNVKARALYAISGLVAHNGALYELFVESNGWDYLKKIISEEFSKSRNDIKVLLRSVNLLKSLLYDEIVVEGENVHVSKSDRFSVVKDNKIIKTTINKLSKDTNVDVNDRILSVLNYISINGYVFSTEELESLKVKLNDLSAVKDILNADDFNNLEKLL